jgi:hypothetical protein
MPREIEQEFINDFDELYARWAVPACRSWAPVWAWGQVAKTILGLVRETTLEFWGGQGDGRVKSTQLYTPARQTHHGEKGGHLVPPFCSYS